MEFFITIPWLIAWPENGFAIVSRDETLDWTPVELERLAKFLPDEVARGAIARGNHNFVAFRFRRFPIDHGSPYDRFDAAHGSARLIVSCRGHRLSRRPDSPQAIYRLQRVLQNDCESRDLPDQ
jgi:hypothetical protein